MSGDPRPGASGAAPAEALAALAAQLREEDSVISAHVRPPAGADPALGLLAAGGVRSAAAPGTYALVVEAVREGYLLHYGESRLLAGLDDDLGLLAGDYLYALGLERLAALGDLEAVHELADLISLSAQAHAEGRAEAVPALWLAAAVALAAGPAVGHPRAKEALRAGRHGAALGLWDAAREGAFAEGLTESLEEAAEAVGFRG